MDKPKIEIAKKNRGKFTQYRRSKGYKSVTRECEEGGLASKSVSVRKMAQFSKNSRSWNKGGK